jgi:hypothetical protein
LVAVERCDVERVKRLVQRGRGFLNTVLLLIIFFAFVHLLTTTFFPFRLLLGAANLWIIIGVAFVGAIVLKRLLTQMIKETLSPAKTSKAS